MFDCPGLVCPGRPVCPVCRVSPGPVKNYKSLMSTNIDLKYLKSSISLRLCAFAFLFFITTSSLHAVEPTSAKIRALYNSLNPQSISEHLAFHQLYPHTPEGKKALREAWLLLNKNGINNNIPLTALPQLSSISSLVSIINKEPDEKTAKLSSNDLSLIENLCKHLGNRHLKGYKATSEEEIFHLKPEEIDLARGLFLSQLGNSPAAISEINNYEAAIDLMALQISTQLPASCTHEQCLHAMNRFIFIDMGFRFPPHSLYAKDIDIYTFLPSVLDSRHGVCLGVSILYLCLAQRLGLPLETITPPGHIYVRYRQGEKTINIETTARGIHLDDEEYLGIDTRKLQQRNIKEVIGLAHMNQAAVHLQQEEYDKSLACYLKALPYLSQDMHLKKLMSFNYLFIGDIKKGKDLLQEQLGHIPDEDVTADPIAEDYLTGKVDAKGIEAIFMRVDETRDSIIKKRTLLEEVLKKHPQFRAGIFALATTWLQLHREAEALEVLEKYYAIDTQDPTVNYYMSALYAERMDYNRAWNHLKRTEAIVLARDHYPETLKELRRQIALLCPE